MVIFLQVSKSHLCLPGLQTVGRDLATQWLHKHTTEVAAQHKHEVTLTQYREGLIYVVRGSHFIIASFLKRSQRQTQHSPISNEICTAAPLKQGKLVRSLSPWKIYAREEKRGSGMCGKNPLPHKLNSHGIVLQFASLLLTIVVSPQHV